jgi:hypothetical protein
VQRLKENLNKNSDKHDSIITKKASRGKRHQNTQNTSLNTDEHDKSEVSNDKSNLKKQSMDLEETILNPGPIIIPNTRSSEKIS